MESSSLLGEHKQLAMKKENTVSPSVSVWDAFCSPFPHEGGGGALIVPRLSKVVYISDVIPVPALTLAALLRS